jgi:hypothetical protein
MEVRPVRKYFISYIMKMKDIRKIRGWIELITLVLPFILLMILGNN